MSSHRTAGMRVLLGWCPRGQVKGVRWQRSSASAPFSAQPGGPEGRLTELGHPEEDTCHVVVDAPEVQVHEVRKVGTDEHLVILCLRDGVPREAERPQVLELPQVDDLGGRGEDNPLSWLPQSRKPLRWPLPSSLCLCLRPGHDTFSTGWGDKQEAGWGGGPGWTAAFISRPEFKAQPRDLGQVARRL